MLEKELDNLNQRDAKLKASVNTMQEQIVSEQRKLKTLQKNIKIDENARASKQGEMDKVNFNSISSFQINHFWIFQAGGVFETLKQQDADDLKAYQDAQKRVEAVNLGLALNDEGEATSLQDQLTSK